MIKILADERANRFEHANRLIRKIDRESIILNAVELEHLEEVEFLIEHGIPLSDDEMRRLSSILYRGKHKTINH